MKQQRILQTLFVIAIAITGSVFLVVSHAATPTSSFEAEDGTKNNGLALVNDPTASGGKAIKFGAGSTSGACNPLSNLLDPCRPLLGATVKNYPETAADLQSQVTYHEQRIGHQVDIVHDYAPTGQGTISAIDQYYASRPNTTLFLDWKPDTIWANAAGGNATDNSIIDSMAGTIKALPTTIFMTINHEPENDVTSAPGTNCTVFKGSSGSTVDFINMWRNVVTRFRNDGVTNVKWSMDFINYPTWDCMIDALYPGNSYVDSIWFNAYDGSVGKTWDSNVSHFYNLLTTHSTTNNNYLSKPWGIVEWSTTGQNSDRSSNGITTADQIAYFDEAASAIQNNTYPRLKGYLIFDSNDFGNATARSFKVGYDDDGTKDQTKQDHYNAVVNAILNARF